MSESDDATLPDLRGATLPARAARVSAGDIGERYAMGDVIGRGGMGEVRLARDMRIEREVAVKLMRTDKPDDIDVTRFFREARVQGVLDHPAVVPVHDLGIDRSGNPYFVMKKLAGTTLSGVLAAKDPATRARWPRRQLLARLVDIGLAIEFAHTRGVVHRDLKPANLMLGDYGEAYVLDWGLARVSSEVESLDGVFPISSDGEGHTVAGSIIGTPGYMSPEQARGEIAEAPCDVFALGCVLYEILAGTPAMPRGMPAIEVTLAAPHHRPSAVSAEVPPELDDLCARATAAKASERPTARNVADAIQAYLDGDRDEARRRELAEEHARRARRALGDRGDEARATAMREAGRALALDPQNETAQYVLGKLLIEAPDAAPPAEAIAAADLERSKTRQKVLRWASHGYLAILMTALVAFALPIRAHWPFVAMVIYCAFSWLFMRYIARKPYPIRNWLYLPLLVISALQLVFAGVMFGPLLIMPIFLIGAIAGFLSQPTGYPAWISIAGFVVPSALVLVLEVAGILPTTIRFDDGAMILTTWALDLTPITTGVLLGLTILTQVAASSLVAISSKNAQEAALNRVHAQTWHMRQLLPRSEQSPSPRVDA